MGATAHDFLSEIWAGLGGAADATADVELTGAGDLPSCFAVTDLATASIASAALAVSELVEAAHGTRPALRVDRRLASMWFSMSIRPQGWAMPSPWDAVAGDYRAADGWIKLHTNAPHHRAAALSVLGVPAERAEFVAAVARWTAEALESAVVEANGCAAALRSARAWASHPQGHAVAAEPLFHLDASQGAAASDWSGPASRPLAGIRVLDLTRVLAGPIATRFLAGFGAEVLRIDPPWWREPAIEPEVTPGKHCAFLDLRQPVDRRRFETLLAQADVLVHGYRSDALERLGLGREARQAIRPGLVDISHDAYGWSGPWRHRRGFDSLVQMSSGIAEAGMRAAGADKPVSLPVQALDHALGYWLAAATVRGLTARLRGQGFAARSSLARVAELLKSRPANPEAVALAPEMPADLAQSVEQTGWGPALRLRAPFGLTGATWHWTSPARAVGTSPAAWAQAV